MGIKLTSEVKETLHQIFTSQRGEDDREAFAYKLLRNLSLPESAAFYIPLHTQKVPAVWDNESQVEAAEAQDIIRAVITTFAKELESSVSSYGKEQEARGLLVKFCREVIQDNKDMAFKALSGSIKKKELKISRHNSGLLGRNKGFEISGLIDGITDVVQSLIGYHSDDSVNTMSSAQSGFRKQVFIKNLSPETLEKLEELYQLGEKKGQTVLTR